MESRKHVHNRKDVLVGRPLVFDCNVFHICQVHLLFFVNFFFWNWARLCFVRKFYIEFSEIFIS